MLIPIEVAISSANGLLPVDTKPLPNPTLTYDQQVNVALTQGQFHKEVHKILSC